MRYPPPKLVAMKQPLRYDLSRFTFASRLVRKGSQLELMLSAANSISNQKNYNSRGVVADETLQDARPVAVEIFHDAKRPSALYVPFASVEPPSAAR